MSGIHGDMGALILRPLILSLYGYDVDRRVSTTHSNDVDRKGLVCYSQKIANVDFCDELKTFGDSHADCGGVPPYLRKRWDVVPDWLGKRVT